MPFRASDESQYQSPSGANEGSPGQAKRSKRSPGYKPTIEHLPLPSEGEPVQRAALVLFHLRAG